MISTTIFNAVLPLATAIAMVYGGTEDAQLQDYYIKTGVVVSESVVETDGGEFTWYVPTDDMSVGEKIVMVCNYHDEVEWETNLDSLEFAEVVNEENIEDNTEEE